MQVLQCLGVSKMRIIPLHPQLDGMAKWYIKTVEEHLSPTTTLATCEAGQRQNENCYDRLANSAGFQKGDSLYCPIWTKSPKLQL
jgi:hypothetical protein